MRSNRDEIIRDAAWYLFDLNIELEKFRLLRLNEDFFRATPFLDARILSSESRFVLDDLSNLSNLFPPVNASNSGRIYIFHIGHCGSTLLSRALSLSMDMLPLREPVPLKMLADLLRDLHQATSMLTTDDWRLLADSMVTAFSRTFRDSQLVAIKASRTCNNLINTFIESQKDIRVLLLHLSLNSYLAVMLARSGISADVRIQAVSRIKDWMNIPGCEQLRLSQLEPIQLIVLAWLTNMYQMQTAARKLNKNVLCLDFDAFLSGPNSHLEEICQFFGLESERSGIVSGYQAISDRY